MMQYYKILGVSSRASLTEIKKAYKEQVKKWHPDRFPHADESAQKKAHDLFSSITEAYQKLVDLHTNRQQGFYEEDRFSGFQRPFNPDFGRATQPPPPGVRAETDIPGYFIQTFNNGDRYEGQFHNGMMHGMGHYVRSNGDVYTGQFRFNKAHGNGKMTFANGDTYTGEFAEDAMCGRGTYIYANGDRYVGRFQDDMPHGEGVLISDGKAYGGQWEFGQLRAEGSM
ncbi:MULTISPECIES: DnaJ domain-containing protein [unclassified Nitrospina]|uniref:DnaJ domain-containing protein n=1 Tax=unclassified Nitrospina TaxID=2638683 RepID=UPI003F9AA60F